MKIKIPRFWRFFKWGYSSSISVTISLGNYNMLRVSQTAPNFNIAKQLLIESIEQNLNRGIYDSVIQSFMAEMFGVALIQDEEETKHMLKSKEG
jgi:hypothetical protein